MIGIRIPVVALSDESKETSDRVAGRPCVRTGFSWESLNGEPSSNDPRINWTLSMVDTGADFTVLDLSFADPLAAMKIPLRLFEARSVVGSSKPLAVYRGTIVVTNGSRCISYETEFVVSDVRSGYYVVLGRDFLKHTTFTYNRARGIEYLTFG